MSLFNCYKFTFSAYIIFVFFLVFGFSTTPGWGDYTTPSMPQFTMPEIKMPDNVKMPTNTFPTVSFPQMPSTSVFTNNIVNFPTSITTSWAMPTYTFPTMPQLNIVFPEDVKLRFDRTFGPLSYSLFSSFPSASYSSSRLPGDAVYISSYSDTLRSSTWSYLGQKGLTVISNIPLESKIPGSVSHKDLTVAELKRMAEKGVYLK